VAEALPLANDRLALLFASCGQLIHVLDRTPVRDVPHFTFAENGLERATAGEQVISVFLQKNSLEPRIGWPKLRWHRCIFISVSSAG
jgi:hypothetical protein